VLLKNAWSGKCVPLKTHTKKKLLKQNAGMGDKKKLGREIHKQHNGRKGKERGTKWLFAQTGTRGTTLIKKKNTRPGV